MSEPTSEKFLVRDPQGNVFGPADADMLRRWVTEGRIVPGMSIAPRDTTNWTEASVHPATADLLQDRLKAIMATQSTTPQNLAETTVTRTEMYYAAPRRQNPLGLLSFVLGLISFLGAPASCLCICVSPVSSLLALAAVTLGSLAVWQIKTTPDLYQGRGIAVAGLTMGTLTLLFYIGMLVVMLIRTLTAHP